MIKVRVFVQCLCNGQCIEHTLVQIQQLFITKYALKMSKIKKIIILKFLNVNLNLICSQMFLKLVGA